MIKKCISFKLKEMGSFGVSFVNLLAHYTLG